MMNVLYLMFLTESKGTKMTSTCTGVSVVIIGGATCSGGCTGGILLELNEGWNSN